MDQKLIKQIFNSWNQNNDFQIITEGSTTTVDDITCTFVEAHTLCYINDHEQITATDLVRVTKKTKPAISQMLKKLEYKGLIRRVNDTENATRYFLYLTEKGKRMCEEHRRNDDQKLEILLDILQEKFSDAEIETAFYVIEEIAKVKKKFRGLEI